MTHPAHPGRPGALAALALTAGPRFGEELLVGRPVATLGRAAGCDVVLDDDSVSAQHARLEWDAGHWRITDLGSVNGTAVEGVKLAPQIPTPLPYGSTVRLGGVKLQLREVAGADPEAARAEFVPPAAPVTLKEERRGPRFPVWLLVLVLLVLAAVAALLVTGTVQVGWLPDPGPLLARAGVPGP